MANIVPSRGNHGQGGMTPSRWSHPLTQLHDEFEHLWDRFFRWPTPFGQELEGERFWGLDLDERDNEVVVTAELPGFEPDDLDVQVHQDMLTIKAERKQEAGAKEGEGGQTRRYAMYRRSVTLPPGCDVDRATASYRNGVLELHIPRSEQAQPKRIAVQRQGQQPAAPQVKHGEAAGKEGMEQPKK